MQSRSVTAARGWHWLAEGWHLFRRKPIGWTLLVLTLFAITKVAALLPVFGLIVFMLMPVFIAGLMEAGKATEEGRPLRIVYLFAAFQRNAAALITTGGISLLGNMALMAFVAFMAGDAFVTLAKVISTNQTITPKLAAELQDTTAHLTAALLAGLALSVPLLMALWFAPPLIQFHGARPLEALKASFVACLRNVTPMLVYSLVIFIALVVLMPLAMAARLYDLAFWPSIYASYRDIFAAAAEAPPPDDPPPA
jgi:hypothetical protein